MLGKPDNFYWGNPVVDKKREKLYALLFQKPDMRPSFVCLTFSFSARNAHKFVHVYMDCLNSSEPDVVLTAAKFLPEFIVLDNG